MKLLIPFAIVVFVNCAHSNLPRYNRIEVKCSDGTTTEVNVPIGDDSFFKTSMSEHIRKACGVK